MGKDKKRRDPSKAAALAAKKEAKAEKSALKRMAKQNSSAAEEEENIDDVLSSMMKQVDVVEYEVLDDFPSPPRGNFTWTVCPTNGMFYMFGGEYYDGSENLVFDDLLRWDPDAKQSTSDNEDGDSTPNSNTKDKIVSKGQWVRIHTPAPHPPARCAHTSIFYNDSIYVFGGECATAEKYHHYRDLWKLDIKSNRWEEVTPRSGTPPIARSGHRAIQWRHYMIIFGGFHESLRAETRFFNDLHIFDFQTSTWTELKYSKLARCPPPRSACNLAICTAPSETLFVYGGYSKLKNVNAQNGSKSEGITHIDCWMLPLKSLVGGLNAGQNPPGWERISRKGEYPSSRAGSSSIVYKNKMILFGGVLDNEGDHHKMDSVFYDDLFSLDLERRRWYALRLKKAARSGGRRRKKSNKEGESTSALQVEEEDIADEDSEEDDLNNGEVISSGWDYDKLKKDMFAFIDGDGNIVYEKIEDDDADSSDSKTPQDVLTLATEAESEVESNDAPDTNQTEQPTDMPLPKPTQKIQSSSLMKVDSKGLPVSVSRQTPLPRINCAIVVKGNTLYVYGGVLEVGEREVTLDDLWSIDLNKREQWTCISPGQMHRAVWKGADDDSYISSDQAADSDDNNFDNEEGTFEPIYEEEENSDEAKKLAKKEAKKLAKKAAKAGIKQEIAHLKEELGTDNAQRTPLIGESVAEFYARTSNFWITEIVQSASNRDESNVSTLNLSSKELKGQAFHLCKARYEEIKPVLDRLNELDALQRKAEEHKKDKRAKSTEKGTRVRNK